MVRQAVDQTDVLLAVIGSQWLTLTAENGGRRIDQPGDWVAEEIGTALRRATPVIPVLVDGARMPTHAELPPALADLANRQAMRIAHESFAADCTRVVESIEEMVKAAEPEKVNLWEDPDYPRARGAYLQGLWPAAIEGFERVLRRHPRQPRVVEQLEQARRNQRLLDLDASAEGAVRAGRWQEAVNALQAIAALQPSDDVGDRIAQAQSRLRVTELQNDVRALAKTGAWAAVLAADAELAGLDRDAGDLDGLATQARAKLLEAELTASYAQGVKQLDEHDWAGAETTFRALLDRHAGYRDAQELVTLAQRHGRPKEEHRPPPVKPATSPAAAAGSSPNPPRERGLSRGPSPLKPESSAGAEPPRIKIYNVEAMAGEVGPVATDVKYVEGSGSFQRALIVVGFAVAAMLLIIIVAGVNNMGRDKSGSGGSVVPPTYSASSPSTSPSSTTVAPNSLGVLHGRLPLESACTKVADTTEELKANQVVMAGCYADGMRFTYRVYKSPAALKKAMKNWRLGEDPQSDCTKKEGQTQYTTRATSDPGSRIRRAGLLTCYRSIQNRNNLAWSEESLNVLAFVHAETGNAPFKTLLAWWQKNGGPYRYQG